MKRSLLLSFITIYFLLLSSCQNKVDLLVHNAKVYSMGPSGNNASAFVVDNGKFIEIGGEELLNKYSARKVLDLQTLPVYPGFIDSHCHFLTLGLSLQEVDLKGTKSFDEVLERLSSYEDRKAIIGRGWDQNDWKNKDLPNKESLDKLYPNIPVALRRIDGHALLVNQKALDLAGITLETKIEGGTIVIENALLTGVLIDAPMRLVNAILPKPSVEDKIKALKESAEICFSNGLTTVSVAGMSKDDIFLVDSHQKEGLLNMRVYAMISNTKKNMNFFLNSGPIKTNKLNVRSFKIYADGSLGSRGAALKENYSDLKYHKGGYHG